MAFAPPIAVRFGDSEDGADGALSFSDRPTPGCERSPRPSRPSWERVAAVDVRNFSPEKETPKH
jgi:hypothetical protein